MKTKIRLKAFHELNAGNAHLDTDDIIRNLQLLPDFLGHLLEDEDQISNINLDIENQKIELTIATTLPATELTKVVEHAISESKLYAKILWCEQ